MEAPELRLITNQLSSSLGKPLGEFKQAATEHHRNLSNIVKDISKMFANQQRDISSLADSVQESTDANYQHGNKLDQTNNLLQESISIQSSIVAEMRNMVFGIRNLTSAVYQNNNNSILGNIFNSLTNLPSNLGGILQGLGLAGAGAAVGAAGATAYNYFSGGTGAGVKQVSNPVMANDIYKYLTKDKGVDHNHAVGILANIQNESSFNSGALGDYQGGVATSGGLFQHHNERFAAMKQAAGPEWQKNWKSQIDYAMSERDMQNYLRTPVTSGQEAARAFVYDFERPKDKSGEAAKRAGNVAAVEKAIGGAANTEKDGKNSQASPVAQAPIVPGATSNAAEASKEKGSADHSHGGDNKKQAIDESKVKLVENYGPGRPERPDDSILNIAKKAAAAAGMASIVATSGKGNYISPEGRAKGQKSTMHSTGLAVDLAGFTNDEQKLEFIKQAKAAGAKGVGVYGNGSVHIDLGRERSWNWGYKNDAAFKSAVGSSFAAGGTQGDVKPNVGPEMPTMTAPTSAESGAAPQQAPTMFEQQIQSSTDYLSQIGMAAMGGGTATTASPAAPAMPPMMGGGMMGGMGVGGIVGSLMPMISSALGSLVSTPANAAQMVPDNNQSVAANMLSQQEIQNRSEDYNNQTEMMKLLSKTKEKDNTTYVRNTQDGHQVAHDYNNDGDRDVSKSWVDKLGFIGYPESDLVKLHG